MPGVAGGPGDFGAIFAQMAARLRALETQQQSIISNAQGQPIVSVGLQPGSNPAEYGIGVLSQAFGSPLAFFGENANGNVGLYFYNSAGELVLQIDDLGLHQYNSGGQETTRLDSAGIHIYNTSGVEIVTLNSNGLTAGPVQLNANGLEVYNGSTLEVQVGLVSSSPTIYGLAVLPYGGSQLQQVGGAIFAEPQGAPNVTNTTATPFGGSSSVTCEIGPSGLALVTAQCQIATGAGGQFATVLVQVDGGSWFEFLNVSTSASGGTTVLSGSTYPWGNLTPGTHTFRIGYLTGNNGTATASFTGPVLTVQPL
jgi:hypothetical protein